MAAMLAESYGHRVVALGNLLPSDARVEEVDSHCFQTVGHNAVEAYGELTRAAPLPADVCEAPRRHTEMTYEVGAAEVRGDEVEDLRALLAAVVALEAECPGGPRRRHPQRLPAPSRRGCVL